MEVFRNSQPIVDAVKKNARETGIYELKQQQIESLATELGVDEVLVKAIASEIQAKRRAQSALKSGDGKDPHVIRAVAKAIEDNLASKRQAQDREI